MIDHRKDEDSALVASPSSRNAPVWVKRLPVWLALLSGVVLAGSACRDDDDDDATTGQSTGGSAGNGGQGGSLTSGTSTGGTGTGGTTQGTGGQAQGGQGGNGASMGGSGPSTGGSAGSDLGGAAGDTSDGAAGAAGASHVDCNGVVGGTATLDHCGVCDSDPSNDCVQDCAGTWGGSANLDDCGTCDDDPSNDCIAHCFNSVRDQDEWGVDCGGNDCSPCTPCSPTFPLESSFSLDVDVSIETYARPACESSVSKSSVTRIIEFGSTHEELWIDGNLLTDFSSFNSQVVGSELRLFYRESDRYFGPCELVGEWFDTPGGLDWSLDITLDLETGHIRARESCYDIEGHCLSNGTYQNGTATGTGANVCL